MKKLLCVGIFYYLIPLNLFSWAGQGYKIIGHYSFVYGVKKSWIKEIPYSKNSPFNEDGTCKKNLPKNVGCKSTADNTEKDIKK